jgi:hypothetical protein
MPYCCVPMCTNGNPRIKVPGISFYRFPVDEKQCNRWIKLIRWVNCFTFHLNFILLIWFGNFNCFKLQKERIQMNYGDTHLQLAFSWLQGMWTKSLPLESKQELRSEWIIVRYIWKSLIIKQLWQLISINFSSDATRSSSRKTCSDDSSGDNAMELNEVPQISDIENESKYQYKL